MHKASFSHKYEQRKWKEGVGMVHVTRIYHSGFLVETENYFLLFDYFKGELPELFGKKIIVFVSHGHGDHYTPTIFELEQKYENVSYVFYHKVSTRRGNNILPVKNHEKYEWEGVEIQTLQSTDEGCAFFIKADGKTFYHAGDLNWWHWEGESEPFNEWQKGMYRKETDALKGKVIDCGFIVVDPRQEHNALLGIMELLKKCEITHIFPMHFDEWGGIEAIKPYLEKGELKPYYGRLELEKESIIADI